MGAQDWLAGLVILSGTPVAIIVWVMLRQHYAPRADVAPGFKMLSLWILLALLTVGVGIGSLGGHAGSLTNLYFVLLGAASPVMLWLLYWKIGVRPRDKRPD